jgi:predicted DNA-binding transcriptional regulator AlpA
MANTKRFIPHTASGPDASGERLILNDDQLYTSKQLAQLFGVHEVTVFNWARQGVISPPFKLGPNTTRWSGRTIRADLERKAGKSD